MKYITFNQLLLYFLQLKKQLQAKGKFHNMAPVNEY